MTGREFATDVAYIFLGDFPLQQQQMQQAFAVCLMELKRQTLRLGGDGIVWLRVDTDLDTSNFQFFYMHAYATAVKRK